MTSSGMKRGLAATAVSALAVTGLPFLTATAHATPLTAQVGGADQVVMYSLYNAGNQASVKNDGQNTTVHLLAAGGANITAVKFQYSLNGDDFVDIETVSARNNDGAFSYEWSPSGISGATDVTIRTVGATATNAAADTYDVRGVDILGGGASANSVNITNGSALGVFQQPYTGSNDKHLVAVSGTTSATDGVVTLSSLTGGATGTAAAPVSVATGATTGTFKSTLDIKGYTYGASGADEIVVGAERDTDDAESFTLYRQAITTITATAENTTVSSPSGTRPVVITVKDQQGAPIAGAQVYDDATDAFVGYTNVDGQLTASAGVGSHEYYANATASTPYEPVLGDKKADTVTITQYAPAATSIVGKSVDGAAFDDDEHQAGDISVQVKDQVGEDFGGVQNLEYHWVLTPFDGSPASVRLPATGESAIATDANGKAVIPFPVSEESGTYDLFVGKPANPLTGLGAIAASKVLTVKAGQSLITYEETTPEQAAAGTTETVAGSLELEDGTGLSGRNIALTYQQGTESGDGADSTGDARFAAVGTTAAGLSRTVMTDSAGGFSVVVEDPAESPQPAEKGGNIDAASVVTTGIGNAAVTRTDQGVDFLSSLVPASVVVDAIEDSQKPGVPVDVTATVKNAAGDTLTNVPLEVSVNHGFVAAQDSEGAPVPDPAPVDGAKSGEWKSLGADETVQSGGSGAASALVSIERDPGFDDDGKVTTVVTVKAGSVSDTEGFQYDSSDPLNPGQVRLELDDEQTVTVLPNAPTRERVRFNVFAEDQFGNLVEDDVEISDDSVPAHFWTNWDSNTARSQFTFDSPAVTASSEHTAVQQLSASWTADKNEYDDQDNNAATPVVLVSEEDGSTVTDDAAAIRWYEVNFATSQFTMRRDTRATVPVNTAVTELVKAVDQKGEPIDGLNVEFLRAGPNPQTGDANYFDTTGDDGKATYTFIGDRAGVANLSAVIFDNNNQIKKLTDVVTFKRRVNADLSARNNAKGNDVLTVSGAGSAVVKLYKVRADGSKVLVAKKRADSGTAKFTVADRAKSRYSRYQAKVLATTKTFADWTPKRRVR